MKLVRQPVLLLLRAYKWAISPMLPPSCRYIPTCSEYAMEAIERHGLVRGGWMAARRLLRCHPFAQGGYDPVAGNVRNGCKAFHSDPALAASVKVSQNS